MKPRHAAVVSACVVMVATVLSFWPATHAEFTTWDDPHNISDNRSMLSPSGSALRYYWSHEYIHFYVPLTYTVWMGIAHFARVTSETGAVSLNPWVFHIANLLTHVACALLALRIFRKMKFDDLPACAGALLFALHPVQVETVAWVTGFRDLLAGLLCLLAIDQYLRADESRFHYAAAILCAALALLSKPSAVSLPLMLAMIDLLLRRRSFGATLRSTLPFFVLALPIIVIGKLVQPATLLAPIPLWWRPLVAGHALAFYLWKIVWPAKFGIDYGQTPQHVMQTGAGYFLWLVPALLIAGAFAWRNRAKSLRARAVITGVGIFVVALAPVLGFVRFEFQAKSTVADHYLYLSMLGIAMIVAAAISALCDGRVAIAPTALLAVALGARTWFACENWQDSYALFTNAIRVNPESVSAHNNLLMLALDESNPQLAEREANWIAQRKPDDMNAQLTLGRAFAIVKRFDEAEALFRDAIRRWPDAPTPHLSLAALLLDLHRPAESLAQYDDAAKIDPNNPDLPTLRARARAMLEQQRSATQP